ncbi:MAG TPA: histidinol dehydrogenase, partial [Holophagaceae bacterium]|nr:histidinol dehydrogenase [Holophagaceae bacterium]
SSFTHEVHRCCFISTADLTDLAELPGRVARLARTAEVEADTKVRVAEILAAVRTEGMPAALRFTETFDGLRLEGADLRVTPSAMAQALTWLERERPALVDALRTMLASIRRFAEAQARSLSDITIALPGGGSVGERWVPMASAGVYIPGGRAFYPSTLAMTVIPAQVAGVDRIVGVTPPRPGGPDPLILAAAALLGLEELITLGGAQGVAWLAYGEGVDFIAGPGNRFVAEAKRQLVGQVGIDALAGPTEVLIIADGGADAARVAEDLLAQAEHDPDAAAVLVSEDGALLSQVEAILRERVAISPKRADLEASLSRHGLLLHAERELAIAFAEAWAPEHLELQVRDPEVWLPHLRAAGALFIGSSSAEAFGDYGAGPNHVLPTSRSARFSSPLGVASFMKRQSLLRLSDDDAAAMAPWVEELATAEGLPHHAASARLRARHHHA